MFAFHRRRRFLFPLSTTLSSLPNFNSTPQLTQQPWSVQLLSPNSQTRPAHSPLPFSDHPRRYHSHPHRLLRLGRRLGIDDDTPNSGAFLLVSISLPLRRRLCPLRRRGERALPTDCAVPPAIIIIELTRSPLPFFHLFITPTTASAERSLVSLKRVMPPRLLSSR